MGRNMWYSKRIALAITFLICVSWSTAGSTSELPAFAGPPVAASEQTFSRPHDLVVSADGRFLYVADVGNNRIAVLDPETLQTLGTIGESELNAPHDVTFLADGRLAVADSGNHRIALFQVSGPHGDLIESWGGFSSPEGVAEGHEGQVYVSNTGSGTVVLVRDGQIRRQVSGFERPHDVLVDAMGKVLIADSGNDRIVFLDRGLQRTKVLGPAEYGFQEPKYLAEDEDGRILIADEYNHQIKILDWTCRPIGTIGDGTEGYGGGHLRLPEGVATHGPDIFVSDTYNNRILRFRRP